VLITFAEVCMVCRIWPICFANLYMSYFDVSAKDSWRIEDLQ